MPMQPSPCAEATRPWVPSGRVGTGMNSILLHLRSPCDRNCSRKRSLGQELHQKAALNLVGGGGAGDGVDDLEALRLLEAGELAVAVGADVIEGGGAAAGGPAGHD